ncbi:MAG: hypothetical protein Q7T01_01745 [bacterium]|nr:hypothetical protein [bacterium]
MATVFAFEPRNSRLWPKTATYWCVITKGRDGTYTAMLPAFDPKGSDMFAERHTSPQEALAQARRELAARCKMDIIRDGKLRPDRAPTQRERNKKSVLVQRIRAKLNYRAKRRRPLTKSWDPFSHTRRST